MCADAAPRTKNAARRACPPFLSLGPSNAQAGGCSLATAAGELGATGLNHSPVQLPFQAGDQAPSMQVSEGGPAKAAWHDAWHVLAEAVLLQLSVIVSLVDHKAAAVVAEAFDDRVEARLLHGSHVRLTDGNPGLPFMAADHLYWGRRRLQGSSDVDLGSRRPPLKKTAASGFLGNPPPPPKQKL